MPDANVFVSALISPTGKSAAILKLWKKGKVEVVTSPAIIDEIARVTSYRKLKKYARVNKEGKRFARLLAKQTIRVNPPSTINVVKSDESDNRYIECAYFGKAQFIVTGDSHLLELKKYKGIYIVNPASLLTIIQLEKSKKV
ncbi:MAG: putative toxin-antitoxin system toxin component, PIN family [Anaerolineae bacterium]|nr:putative toxin-antitoxin system toxin component, PIN family [Anaerolineae bacterium]